MDDLIYSGLSHQSEQEKRRGKRTPLAQPLLSDNIGYLQGVADEFFDLIVTSPPYNIGKSYETRRGLPDYLRDQELLIGECVRALNKNGSICW